MKRKKHVLFLLAGLMMIINLLPLFSLDPQKRITQYIHKKWTTANGLPNNNIYAILQTGSGYLWIGTTGGLARFDGVKFEIFNKNNTEGIPDNRITVLFESSDNTLWIGSRGGLSTFKNGTFKSLTKKNGLLHDVVKAIREDSQGHLWVGYRGKGISVFKKGDFSSLSHPAALSQVPEVRVFLPDKRGNLWIGTGEGLFHMKKGKPVKIERKRERALNNCKIRSLITGRVAPAAKPTPPLRGTPPLEGTSREHSERSNSTFPSWAGWTGSGRDGLESSQENKILVHSNTEEQDSILAGTEKQGLLRYTFKDEKSHSLTSLPGLQSSWVNVVFSDKAGNTWAGTEGGGLHRLTGGHISIFSEKEGLSNDSVNCIYEDREDNLWVGTYSGLNLLMDGKFTCYTEKEGLLDNVTWTVYEDSRQNLWITTNEGLNRFNMDSFIPFQQGQGLSSNFVSSTYEDQRGNLWVGTYDKGLNLFKDGQFTPFGSKQGLGDLIIRAVFVDSRGNIWAGSSGKGLYKIESVHGSYMITSLSTKNGLSNDHVFVIYEDLRGGIWIGTDGGGINYLHDGRITLYGKDRGLSSDVIFSILEERDNPGTFWIGTEDNGLNYFRAGKFIPVTVKNGLEDNTVYQIIEDDSGFFWMSGQKGITRIHKRQLHDFVSGRTRAVKPSLFGRADGLKGDECNGGFQPAGWRSADGNIWFPTPKGLVVVNPDDIKINKVPPPVRIEKIVVNGKNRYSLPHHTLTLKPPIRKIEIHYTALSLSEPQKVDFKYMLAGFEDEWAFKGKRKDRIATYTNISPGDYTFRVTACNNDDIWNVNGVSLNLSVLHPFWQRWWFIAAAVLIFSVLSYFILSALKNLFKVMDFWRKKHYIGKYRIIDRIGQGGMANIFKVDTGKGTKKNLCALKLMKDEYISDAVYRSRFLHEGEIIDNIDHPHIVKVFERGEYDHNLFIAMELVEGVTLEDVMKQKGPLATGDSLDIMIQLLDALAMIHRAGIIHRDLKPGNIMLVEQGNKKNFVKLLDFGLAKTCSLSRVTETGMAVGTLNYLSPEQILDSSYSSASDIYAAGVIFYEMLTGERPYQGETPLEMIQAIFKNDVIEPAILNKTISGQLNRLLLTTIDKNAGSRPSAEVLKLTMQKLKARDYIPPPL